MTTEFVSNPSSITLKAVVRYDGSRFNGWQIQPDLPTVQGAMEAALHTISGRPIRIHGASRTDAGVHALGQVCSFPWPKEKPRSRLRRSLSQMLGPAIRIDSVVEALPGFNARFDATGKRYGYTLVRGREMDPFLASYAWRVPHGLDMEQLASLAPLLIGSHDFAGFQSTGSPREGGTVRTLFDVRLARGGVFDVAGSQDHWRIEAAGDGFLYHMVRNIAGTLVDAVLKGEGEAMVLERLASKTFRGLTAPAQGLALMRVFYGDEDKGQGGFHPQPRRVPGSGVRVPDCKLARLP